MSATTIPLQIRDRGTIVKEVSVSFISHVTEDSEWQKLLLVSFKICY